MCPFNLCPSARPWLFCPWVGLFGRPPFSWWLPPFPCPCPFCLSPPSVVWGRSNSEFWLCLRGVEVGNSGNKLCHGNVTNDWSLYCFPKYKIISFGNWKNELPEKSGNRVEICCGTIVWGSGFAVSWRRCWSDVIRTGPSVIIGGDRVFPRWPAGLISDRYCTVGFGVGP